MIDVIFADFALLAINKPAGLLAVPGRGADKQDCAAARAQQAYADALVVHRLDQATSGLMLFARGQKVQAALARGFEDRRIDKEYVAVVAGHVALPTGTIDLPIAADWPARPKQMVNVTHGKPAITHYTVLARNADGTSRVLLNPITGRTHQLRVHMAAIGHAIVGDTLYAPPAVALQSARLLLHAQQLTFVHPESGELFSLRAPAPF